jgi:hypothetical protein
MASPALARVPSTVVAAYHAPGGVPAIRTYRSRIDRPRGWGWVVATHPATTCPGQDSIQVSFAPRSCCGTSDCGGAGTTSARQQRSTTYRRHARWSSGSVVANSGLSFTTIIKCTQHVFLLYYHHHYHFRLIACQAAFTDF